MRRGLRIVETDCAQPKVWCKILDRLKGKVVTIAVCIWHPIFDAAEKSQTWLICNVLLCGGQPTGSVGDLSRG